MAQLIVGLDIGTSAVRAAELDTGPSRPVLVTYGQVGLPPGSVVDGEVRDRAAVTEAIRASVLKCLFMGRVSSLGSGMK